MASFLPHIVYASVEACTATDAPSMEGYSEGAVDDIHVQCPLTRTFKEQASVSANCAVEIDAILQFRT